MFQQTGDPLLAALFAKVGSCADVSARVQKDNAPPAPSAKYSDRSEDQESLASSDDDERRLRPSSPPSANAPLRPSPAPVSHNVRSRLVGDFVLRRSHLRKIAPLRVSDVIRLLESASPAATSGYGFAELLAFAANVCGDACPAGNFEHFWQILARYLSLNEKVDGLLSDLRDKMVAVLKTEGPKSGLIDVNGVVERVLFSETSPAAADAGLKIQQIALEQDQDEAAAANTSSAPGGGGRPLASMPKLGLGLWKVSEDPSELKALINHAISLGCRRFDTAPTYDESETLLAECIANQEGRTRGEFFISTKLPDEGWGDPASCIEASCAKFGGYVDLYLIHHPVTELQGKKLNKVNFGKQLAFVYGVMKQYQRKGKLLRLGVCNFSDPDLELLKEIDGRAGAEVEKLSGRAAGVDEQGDHEAPADGSWSNSFLVLQGKFSLFHPFGAYADPEAEYEKALAQASGSFRSTGGPQRRLLFDGVSLVQEVNQTGKSSCCTQEKFSPARICSSSATSAPSPFSALNCAGLVDALVEAYREDDGSGGAAPAASASTSESTMAALVRWRADWRGYCGLVRCRSKAHLDALFASAAANMPDESQQHLRAASAYRSATPTATLYAIFDRLHKLVALPSYNVYHDRQRLLGPIFSLDETPPLDLQLATEQFQSLMATSRGFPDLVEKLKTQLKKNGATGLLSTKAFVVALAHLIAECKRRNLQNRVTIYTKVEELLKELYETERASSVKKLGEFLLEKEKREEQERKDVKKSYTHLWDEALRGNSWVWEGFAADRGGAGAGGGGGGNRNKAISGKMNKTAGANGGEPGEGRREPSPQEEETILVEALAGHEHFSECYVDFSSATTATTEPLGPRVNAALDRHHFCILENFFPTPETAEDIKKEVFGLDFTPSEIWVGQDGGIGAHVHKPEVRGDDIVWICGQHRTHWTERWFDSAGVQPDQVGRGSSSTPTSSESLLQVCRLPDEDDHYIHRSSSSGTTTTSSKKTSSASKKKLPQAAFPALSETLTKLDRFIYESVECVGELVERSDCMIGRYSGSKKARFQKHIDNTQEDGRRLACVVYLNHDWDIDHDGGELKLHLDHAADPVPVGGVADFSGGRQRNLGRRKSIVTVAPRAGRVAIFRADLTEHEVCPVVNMMKDRFSFLVWYFQREERAKKIRSEKSGGGHVLLPSHADFHSKNGNAKAVNLELERSAQELVERVTSGKETADKLNWEVARWYEDEVKSLAGRILGLRSSTADGGGGGAWITDAEVSRAREGIAKMGRR